MAKEIPKIEQRNFDDLLNEFKALVPFYTPEWRLEEKGKGADLALVKIFIQYLGTIYHRLNRLPEKHFISFLHEIGTKRIPAQSAFVPVTFLLSEGTGGPVLITAGTQAAAGDVIFETEKNLLACPAKLVNIFHTDGEKDAVFPAPANIVSGEPALAVETKLLYPVNSGDKDIFVQSGEDLLEGDIVCIGKNNDGVEYGIVSAVSENRVTLVHPLGVQEPGCLHLPTIAIHGIGEVFSQRLQAGGIYTVKQLLQYSGKVEELGEILGREGDGSPEYYREQVKNILENAEKCVLDDPYKVMQESGPAFHHQPGTAVKKITSLELFKGKNLQEHILYLGHEELFNIAADALIIFRVTVPQWAAVLSAPGAVQWEYWGEAVERRAVGEEENPGWHPLEVRPGDPAGGEFYLRKLFTGEIAEYPLNDITGRWLRCKVKDINKTKDIELKDINVRVADVRFLELPPVAIRGIGDTFAQRLAKKDIHTIEQLLEYRDKAFDLAVMIASEEQFLKYYKKMSEKFLENAQELLLDEKYEQLIFTGKSPSVLLPDMVFYKKITGLERSESENCLYLGHEELFNIDADAMIIFRVTNPQWGKALSGPGAVQWEYWGEAAGKEENPGWHPLEVWPQDPSTGIFYLRKLDTDRIDEYTLNDIASRWLRCKVKDIAEIEDIELNDINVRVLGVCFLELPVVAIRGIGDIFAQRLAEKDIHTVEKLLEYKDSDLEVAGMIVSDEQPLEYYREMAENFLHNAEKLLLDEKYEQLLVTSEGSSVLLPDMVFYKKITGLELSESESRLYLGRKELFNIDTDAIIIFRVTLPEWGEALSVPGAVQWEYWGEPAGKGESPGWHPLEVHPGDPAGGEFYLRKLFTDKIAEYNLNDITSRWLRCKVTDINKIKDIEPNDINVRVVDVCFLELPPVAIRGIGDTFAQRLAEEGIHTVGQLLEYRDNALDVAVIIVSDEQPLEYYREMAENFLQNAEKFLLDEEYEKMLIAGKSSPVLPPDMVFYHDLVYDLTATDNHYLKSPIHPFGKKPVLDGTFYISCREFFSKPETGIRMNVEFSPPGVPGDSEVGLYWEYWDGEIWNIIKDLVDNTGNFTGDGEVTFTIPVDIAAIDVNGKENFYIRVRLVSGDYGREEFVETTQTVEVDDDAGNTEEKEINVYKLDDSKISPPVITKLLLSSTYEFIPEFYPLKHCLASNNLELIDRVKESWDPGKVFKPFIPLEGGSLVFYLAFDRKLEKGPVTLFFAIAEKPVAAEQVPTIHWQYYNEKRQWQRLDVLDATTSLTRTGVIEFVFPPDFKETRIFSTTAYWIRAVYIEEEKAGADDIAIPTITGVFLNTTWALQRETISAEILGSGDGSANQAYSFKKTPVATGSEEIWVDEFKTISAEEQRQILEENQYLVKRELDEKENLTEFWIKWKPIDSILNASANDRYYEIDNVSGVITFGDGSNGKILPTGTDNIKADYSSGGGKQGNLPVFEVTELKTSIPFLDSAFNPLAAGGGTDTEAIGRVMERGPYLLKHHNRAITVEDFEQLAFQAAGGIARVKCLPNMDEQRESRDGRVTVIVIPQTEEEKPRLSLQMKYKVERHLQQRAAYRMVEKDYLRVIGPVYVDVSIHAQLAAASIEMIPLVEKAYYSRLKEFLNPLSGGNEKRGWDFGKIPCFSDFYALLEKIENVDHVKDMFIKVTVPDIESTSAGLNSEYILTPENPGDFTMPPYAVICSGDHKVVVSWQ
jgi:predicted flap endonuclease-1-like 5' DNA nuclease